MPRSSVSSTPPEDAVAPLLEAVAAGDRAAFEDLYRACAPRMFGICLRLLPDRADAEEVLQEVFAGVWHKAGQFDPARADATAWLGMITRYKAIDRLRAGAGPRQAPIDAADHAVDPGASPMQAAEGAEAKAQLDLCLEQLDERRRGLIRTAFFDGATYEELAARIGSPIGTVKSWIRRGLAQLKVCLEA